MTTHFTDSEIAVLKDGIRKFIRLIGLYVDPLQGKWVAEEQDAVAGLESVCFSMKQSVRMLGKRKYQGLDFDHVNECKKDLMVYLLTGNTEATDAGEKKRNLPLYHLIIEPTIQAMSKYTHQESIDYVDELTAEVAVMIRECNAYGTFEDALIAQAQIKTMIREREDARLEAIAKRRPKKNKRAMLLEMFAGVLEERESEEVEEL